LRLNSRETYGRSWRPPIRPLRPKRRPPSSLGWGEVDGGASSLSRVGACLARAIACPRPGIALPLLGRAIFFASRARPRLGSGLPLRKIAIPPYGPAIPRRKIAIPRCGIAFPSRGIAISLHGLAIPRRKIAIFARYPRLPRRKIAIPRDDLSFLRRGSGTPSRSVRFSRERVPRAREALRSTCDIPQAPCDTPWGHLRSLGAIRDSLGSTCDALEITSDTFGLVRRPIAPTRRWITRASRGPPTQRRGTYRDRRSLRLTTLGKRATARCVRRATPRAHVPSRSEAIGHHSRGCHRSFQRGHRDRAAIARPSVRGLWRGESFVRWGRRGSRRRNATLAHGRVMQHLRRATSSRGGNRAGRGDARSRD